VWLNSKHKARFAAQMAAVGALLLALGPSSMIHRLEQIRVYGSVESGSELSTRIRWELDRAAIHMIESHPVFGVGLDQFRNEEVRYNPRLLIVDPYQHIAHNTYLELGAEGGMPTLALYLAILILTLYTCKEIETDRAIPEAFTSLAYSVRIGLIGFMVAAVFLSAQYVKEPWVLVCLAPNLLEISRQAAGKRKRTAQKWASRAQSATLTPQYRAG
ncbi:MAG TPA: O-antigen ligase family protein, partial [Candidatus Binataceae bacterium]|nr:O-antigen ligase family protein [Candidatus Binataceae bacterium]